MTARISLIPGKTGAHRAPLQGAPAQKTLRHYLNGGRRAKYPAMFKDIRYSLRTLRNHPGFTLTAIMSIAIAMGANSALFSF
jgi:hypothetical protein